MRPTKVLQKDQRGFRWLSETPEGKAHLTDTRKPGPPVVYHIFIYIMKVLRSDQDLDGLALIHCRIARSHFCQADRHI